jgi:hypothetical protein
MHRHSRAVLIAVVALITVLGAVPVGTLATAPPTAQEPSVAPLAGGDEAALQLAGTDADLRSGGTFWQGWELGVDASGILDGDARDIEVWRVTEDGQLSQRVATVTANDDGIAIVGTGDLEGRYVLRYGGDPVYVQDGTAYLDSPPDGSTVTIESSTFRVERQTLTYEESDPEVFPGQGTVLTASSNRDRFVVAISGDGLSYQNLTTLVPDSAYAADHDARAEDDRLLVEVRPGDGLRLNTSVLEPGSQRLNIGAVDTTALARVTLTVKQPASNRRIVSVEWRDNVGDVLEAELACSSCYLAVGTPEQGTLDLLELTDANGDGRITLRINTRYAGQYTGASGYPDGVESYTSPDDDVRRYASGTTLEQVDEELSYTIDTLGKLRDQLGLRATGRDRPIDPGPLQLTVAETDFLINRSAYGDRAPYGSDLVIRDETDARTIELEPRSFDGVHSMAAPGGSGFEPTAEALRTGTGPRERVALGDRLVFRINVSGIYGYLDAQGATVATFQENEEGIGLSLVDRSGGSAESVAIDRLDVRFVPDPSSNALYVVFPTGAGRLGALEAGQYRLRFTLEGVSGGPYSIRTAHDGYPYLAPGASESDSASVTIEPPAASITDPSEGASPRLTGAGELEVRGTTNVAAGTRLRVSAESTEFAYQTSVRATVNETGHWRASLDLSDAPGDSFTVAVSDDGQVLDEGTFTVQTPTPGGSDGGDGSGDGGDGGDGVIGGQPGDGSLLPGGSLAIYGIAAVGFLFILVIWRVVL